MDNRNRMPRCVSLTVNTVQKVKATCLRFVSNLQVSHVDDYNLSSAVFITVGAVST